MFPNISNLIIYKQIRTNHFKNILFKLNEIKADLNELKNSTVISNATTINLATKFIF